MLLLSLSYPSKLHYIHITELRVIPHIIVSLEMIVRIYNFLYAFNALNCKGSYKLSYAAISYPSSTLTYMSLVKTFPNSILYQCIVLHIDMESDHHRMEYLIQPCQPNYFKFSNKYFGINLSLEQTLYKKPTQIELPLDGKVINRL